MTGDTDNELLVGVTKKPDGGWDFSHAAVMRSETKISDPVADRLRGPLVIDKKREESYLHFRDKMSAMAETGEAQKWFLEMMNKLRSEGTPELTPDDIKTLKFVADPEELDEINSQYGFEYARSYFQLSLQEYKTVYERLTGRRDSNGCQLKGSYLDRDDLTKDVGLVVAPSLGPDIIHELEHTIDPNLENRSPADQVLEELAVYYRETYVPRIYITKSRTGDAQGNYSEPVITERKVYSSTARIKAILEDDLYAGKYAKAFSSNESYRERVDSLIKVVDGLEKFMTKPDVNKAIYNAASFNDLSHLLNVLQQEGKHI